jgi:hypothetical protein
VVPKGIALILALPISYSEFVTRVARSDWLSRFNDRELSREAFADALTKLWNSQYLPFVAKPLQQLIEVAGELKVEVRTQATLETFREATSWWRNVILFAHWKGPEVLDEDLIQEAEIEKFLQRVRSEESPMAQWLRKRLEAASCAENEMSPSRLGLLHRIGFTLKRARLASLIQILSEAVTLPLNETDSANQLTVLESDDNRFARQRDRLNSIFKGLLRPGNRLELFDGLHSKESIEGALFKDFEGVLDLTSCTSTILGDYIGAKRRHRVRTVQFASVQEVLWGSRCVSLALRVQAEQNISYQQARVLASKMMKHELERVRSRI